MKKIILTAALLAASFSAQATDKTADKKWFAKCVAIQSLAERVMDSRQQGVSLAKVYEASEGFSFGQEMILLAYKKTKWSSEKRKTEAVKDFGEMYLMACISENK